MREYHVSSYSKQDDVIIHLYFKPVVGASNAQPFLLVGAQYLIDMTGWEGTLKAFLYLIMDGGSVLMKSNTSGKCALNYAIAKEME